MAKSKGTEITMTAQEFAELLIDLASVALSADSLKMDLEPISSEDAAAGAEPVPNEQIQAELHKIATAVTRIALQRLGASAAQWYAAVDAVPETEPQSHLN